jgi:alcohol dehydrogenase class IV
MDLSQYYNRNSGGEYAFTVEAPKIKFGVGCLREIGPEARLFNMSRVALFTDPRVAKLEPVAIAKDSLRKAGIEVVVYDEVEVEPTDDSFKAGAKFAQEGDFDGYVSVGGGSVMDTCKASNLYASHPPDSFLAYVNAPIGEARPVPGPVKPHIACPTTFGTGSECTGLAIFDFLEMEAKTAVAYSQIRPSLGMVDPASIQTLPAGVIASNGFDVFSHAVESLTARPYNSRPAPETPDKRPIAQGANPYSDIGCLEAIRLIGGHLVDAVHSQDDIKALEALSFAGLLAGIGFGSAGCTIPHGMSYAVSGLVKEYKADGWPQNQPLVPHGISVIVNSPSVFRFTGPACPDRHLAAAAALGADIEGVNKEAGDVLADKVIEMMRATGMPNGIGGVGYTADDIPMLTEKSWPQRRVLDNAPVELTKAQLSELFRGALSYW